MSIRRYTTMPTNAQILEIEGIVIVDLAPPPVIKGIGTGVVGMVGEFLNGPFSNPFAPLEITSTQDFLDKLGDYDSRIGDSGKEGNGYRALMRRMFSKLICVRVDTTQGQILTITRAAGATGALTIAAGTEIKNNLAATKKYMTDRIVTWAAGEVGASFAKTIGLIGIGTVNAGLNELDTWVAGIPETGLTQTNPDFATKINPISSALLDTVYSSAIDKLNWGTQLTSDISIVFSARTSQVIRNALKTHVDTQSDGPRGRMAITRGIFGETQANAQTQAQNSSSKGDRLVYCWPNVQSIIPKISSDPTDTMVDSFLAAILSQLASERDPAETTNFVQRILSPISGLEGGAPTMGTAVYKSLKANGISAPVFEPLPLGAWFFQSGVTTSLTSGLEPIYRRRKADQIEDTLGAALLPYQKSILTNSLKTAIVGQIESFLEEEKIQERISDYKVDPVSGNTQTKLDLGIFVVIVQVKLFASARNIVLQAEIGETVKIIREAA